MSKETPTVSDIFRRAQELWLAEPGMALKDLRARLVAEYRHAPVPSAHTLTVPEQDARAPEEDWTAGLPLVMRGIQSGNWGEIISGVLLCLEQTVRYERERGPVGAADHWHDRSAGIRSQVEKGVSKWMPDELMKMAERSTKSGK